MTRTLLVASPGGHVDELRIQAEQMGIDPTESVWLTARTPHTESVLADCEVVWVPKIGSGEKAKAMAAMPAAFRLHHRLRPQRVVSTGALLAVPHLVAASAAGCETWFIDSATRLAGPSQTGRLAARLPRVRLLAQGQGWGDPRWQSIPSVFDAFEVASARRESGPIRSAVVSLGTEHWPFKRAVEKVLELLPQTEIVWQTGTTTAVHSGHELQHWLPAAQLRQAIRDADVVITHAGVGSALVALDEGKVPVFLPRTSARGEHVDNHQREVADMLAARSLAVTVDPDDLRHTHLLAAASLKASRGQARAPLAAPVLPVPRQRTGGQQIGATTSFGARRRQAQAVRQASLARRRGTSANETVGS